jgi:hypothetical protein
MIKNIYNVKVCKNKELTHNKYYQKLDFALLDLKHNIDIINKKLVIVLNKSLNEFNKSNNLFYTKKINLINFKCYIKIYIHQGIKVIKVIIYSIHEYNEKDITQIVLVNDFNYNIKTINYNTIRKMGRLRTPLSEYKF